MEIKRSSAVSGTGFRHQLEPSSYPKRVRQTLFSRWPWWQRWSQAGNDQLVVDLGSLSNIALHDLLDKLQQSKLIGSYGPMPNVADYPKLNFAAVNFTVEPAKELSSWGYTAPTDSFAVALSKALGEALERYASYSPLKTSIYQTKDVSWLWPQLPRFTPAQLAEYPELARAPADLKALPALKLGSLTGDWSRYFPSEFIYWGDQALSTQNRLIDRTTSGCGGGFSPEDATTSAWLEVIERDHFLVHWHSGQAPQYLKLSTLPESLQTLTKKARDQYKLDIYWLNLNHDDTALVIACVIVDPVLKRVSLGAKAGLAGEEVCQGAYLEALSTLVFRRERGFDPAPDLATYTTAAPHTSPLGHRGRMDIYQNEVGIKAFSEYWLTGAAVTYQDWVGRVERKAASTFDHLVKSYRELAETDPGFHAYVYHFPTAWPHDISYHVARVVIPNHQVMYLNEHLAAPLHPRVKRSENAPYLPHLFP